MSKKVFIGNLPFQTTESDLTNTFAQYGPVQSAQIITDRETGVLRKYDSTGLAGSCGNLVQPVFVMQAGENRSHDDSTILGNRMTIGLNLCFRRTPVRDSWAQAGMRTVC